MNWLSDFYIAHRGLHSNDNKIPENSLKAYSSAIQYGYAIELDVRLSKDLQLVVFHDEDLKRMCNKEGKVYSYNLIQLQTFNLLNSEETIPSLKEVFKLVNKKVPILIEIKNEKSKVGILEKVLLKELYEYNGEVAIQSFNPMTILWFRKHAPTILRGQLSSNFKNENLPFFLKYALKYMVLNIVTKPDFIAYEKEDISKDFLQKFRKKGKILLCWTIKNKHEKNHVLSYCNNIIFEGFTPKKS